VRLRVGLLIAATALTSCSASNEHTETIRLTIPRGATLTAVAETLVAHDVIRSQKLFKLYATVSGRQRAIQAGTYELPETASMRRVLMTLVSGGEVLERLVLPEGLMLGEVAEWVSQQIHIDPDSFLAACRDPELLARTGAPVETLEGYLYPSTYYVRVNATAREVVRHMLDEFKARWRAGWDARAQELGMSPHEVVILASIIEGEVRYDPDRKYVSSVYHNRLARHMRLQADPTVIYALGRRRRLYQRDYQIRSPYNTYLIDGLPPGPICQPSEASLEAALFPANTDFLYFVAGPGGKHVFSRTYREHLAAIREVRRQEAGQTRR
jgi:UPF0755 protein